MCLRGFRQWACPQVPQILQDNKGCVCVCMFQTVTVEEHPGTALLCSDWQVAGLLLKRLEFYLTNAHTRACAHTHVLQDGLTVHCYMCFRSGRRSIQGWVSDLVIYLTPEFVVRSDVGDEADKIILGVEFMWRGQEASRCGSFPNWLKTLHKGTIRSFSH